MPPVSALWPSFLVAAVAPTLVASSYFAVLSGGAPDVAFIALLAFAIAAAHVTSWEFRRMRSFAGRTISAGGH